MITQTAPHEDIEAALKAAGRQISIKTVIQGGLPG